MRNLDRLEDFYDEIHYLHKTYLPDWRFMQLISNFVVWYGRDPFYLEEDKVIELLHQYLHEIKVM